jgi:integral membrane protein
MSIMNAMPDQGGLEFSVWLGKLPAMSPVFLLRIASFAEGVSFIVLLYFAIYHKRILGDAEAIRVPGMIHGVLFLIFCLALFQVWADRKWPLKKVFFAFICALLPFAPFYLEHKLRREPEA